MDGLESTLTCLDMLQYRDRLLQAGFDSWEILCEITEEDLEALNIELGHRRKLQREIAKTRSPAFPTPPYQSLPGAIGSQHAESQSQPILPGKRGYRHHPKPDDKAPVRPYSAYVMFSNYIRDEVKDQSMPFTEISKLVGDRWQALPPAEKDQWKQKAAIPWEKYKQDLAAYQKTEDFRKYEQYVANFKAAQAAKKIESEQRTSYGYAGITDLSHQQRSPESISDTSPSAPILQSRTSTQQAAQQSTSPSHNVATNRSNPKLLISRARGRGSRAASQTSTRVNQACQSCRQRRIKCNGERPVCKPCEDYDIECVYQDGKRDKERRLMEQLWRKVKAYEELLLDFAPQLESEQQSAVQRAILLAPSSPNGREVVTKPSNDANSSESSHDGESTASGVGSMGSTDHVNYDDFKNPAPNMKPPAYVGQASEVSWMQRLHRELKKEPKSDELNDKHPALSSVARPLTGRPDATLWPEDMDSSIIGSQVDPYGLPIKSTADALVKAFFSTVHPAFPILDQAAFLQQYERQFTPHEVDPGENDVFVALLQAVLAIGAVHAHVTNCQWVGDDRDHLLYFARSRLLSTYAGALSESVSMGQVQLLGLAAVYLITTDQTNRAWSALGVAIRCAQGLGMHLKNVTPKMSEQETVRGMYVWFALVSTERVLSTMIGRPCMVKETDCSAPLPLPVGHESQASNANEVRKAQTASLATAESQSESPTSTRPSGRTPDDRTYEPVGWSLPMTYFFHYLELSCLSQRVMEGLYNPHIRHQKWSEIQRKIQAYDKQLTQWTATLPSQFDLPSWKDYPQSEPYRAALAILSYSTRTIINRPALCRTERQIRDQSEESVETSHDAAQRCVHAARAMLQFLPGERKGTNLRQSPLWWTILHHIKRSAIVLLLEIAFRAEHMPSEAEEILADAIKAVNWIHSMGTVSLAARRAWSTLSKSLQVAAHRVGGSTAHLNTSAPQPHGSSGFSSPPGAQSKSGESFDLNTWVPMSVYPGDEVINSNPLYGDMQMGGMDHFGFMRPSGQDEPFFPSASEIGDLAAQHQQVEDQEMWQPPDDPETWFGFEPGQNYRGLP